MSTLYTEHFRLREAPFSIAPNPRFLFMSEQHREALAHLLYGIGHDGGFVLLTGEVGTGKTTLCRCLLERIPDDTDVAFIINPRLSVVDLLANICDELGIEYASDNLNNRLLVDAINHYLLACYAEGRKTVLIIDEAQNLDSDVLEQLRLLTNLETDERKLLQIILLGQPELQDKLARAELRQLSQRITARYHLQALNHSDMQAYITHRLSVAGCDKAIFSTAAQRFVYRQSKGIPRLINLICDRAMLGAFAGGLSRINRFMVRQATREVLGGPVAGKRSVWKPALAWSAFSILLIATAAWTAERWMAPHLSPSLYAPASSEPQTSQPASAELRQDEALSVAQVTEARQPELHETEVPLAEDIVETPPAINEATQTDAAILFSQADSDILQNRQAAFHDLFAAWGLNLAGNADPCVFAVSEGLACLQQVGDLGRLRSLNRPAVLDWQSDNGGIRHITLVEIRGSTARAVAGDSLIDLPLEQLRQHWLDRFTILWRTPQAYGSDILPGTVGPSAKWLNERLTALHPATTSGTAAERIPGIYQGVWVRRLRKFQRDAGLLPDGVAGPQTLIQLNTQLHEPGPRLMTEIEDGLAAELQQAAKR